MGESAEHDGLVRFGEAARVTGVSTAQLQYYLYMGVVKETKLTKGGQRLFDRRALAKVRMVKLLNDSGYPLREIRDIFMTDQKGAGGGRRRRGPRRS